nr:hypothetical protein CFP56_14020 [Quercus suber]
MAEAHVQSLEEQLAEIDAGIAKFDAPNGRDGKLESEISNSSSPQPRNAVDLQRHVSDLRLPRLDEPDELIANIRGKVRNVQRKPKQLDHACNVEDEGLLRGVGSTILIKRNKRDFDEGLEVSDGGRVHHLNSFTFDHRPILVSFVSNGERQRWRRKPFRFEVMW